MTPTILTLALKLLGPILARMIFAAVLKDRLEFDIMPSGDMAEALVDSLDIGGAIDRLTDGDRRSVRQGAYIFETIGDEVAEKVVEAFEREAQPLAEGELQQVVEAAKETLNRWSLKLLLDTNFDPIRFRQALRQQPPKFQHWSDAQTALYERVLENAARYVFAAAENVPHFTRDTTARLLQDTNELLQKMRENLDYQKRILAQTYGEQIRTESQRFEADYCTQLANACDRLSLFGVPLIDGVRQPLTVAFVQLEMAREVGQSPRAEMGLRADHEPHRQEPCSVEEVFAAHTRVVIKAGAGCGKTTLLKWAAVQLARQLPDIPIDQWRNHVRFLIQLRDYGKDPLPAIDALPLAFKSLEMSILRESTPERWAIQQVRDRRAVIFLDGLDEVNQSKQEEALLWMEQIIQLEPQTVLVVSGRPSAIEDERFVEPELSRLGFQTFTLMAMDEEMVSRFVELWHTAIAHTNCRYPDKERVPARKQALLAALADREELRSLAGTPLLCAMLCALNLTQLGELPQDRIQLYNACVDVLLERDHARGIAVTDYGEAPRPETARRLLARLACHMLENNEPTLVRADVERLIGAEDLDGVRLATYLSERSGLLQQQSKDVFVFLHRALQEFLAAEHIVRDHRVKTMAASYCGEASWRETFCLLAGCAAPPDQKALLETLLDAAAQDKARKAYYHRLAWEFWELLDEATHSANALVEAHARGLCRNGGLSLRLEGTIRKLAPLQRLTQLQARNLSYTQVSDVSA